MASATALDDALRVLGRTAYRRDLGPGASLAEAQRAVGATLLWHLRVLAGWQSRKGADAIRRLAAGFEISNVEEHLRELTGTTPWTPAHRMPRPYRLGALAGAWPRLARTRSPAGLRAVLATSVWGDPGAASPAAVATGMRISAAVRAADGVPVPEAAAWAAGRLALLMARETFLLGRRTPPSSVRHAARLLGTRVLAAESFRAFRDRLPATAGWALDGIDDVTDLWRAEGRWWARIGRDGAGLLRGARPGPAPVVGAVALLCADAWRVRGALELAARGGGVPEEFDVPA